MSTVVFVHAHPDDEAIFSGGTMRLLADAGHRVVLVVATSGERGIDDGRSADGLASTRLRETSTAADILGISLVLSLDFEDSGMEAENPTGLAHVESSTVVERLIERLEAAGVEPDALVGYDEGGIYDHPDHLAIHPLVHTAGERLAIPTVYDATVDREYLHFVETHLVVEAGLDERPTDLGLASTSIGLPTLLIDIELDTSAVADVKRAAMAAHESQIPESSSALQLDTQPFSAVYGYEWYVRTGPTGAIDDLLG
ncbi:MAG: PIG-L deacetylase family protein [Actinomycetota bacterium]